MFSGLMKSVGNLRVLPYAPARPLTRWHALLLKNWMVLGVLLANVVAMALMEGFLFKGGPVASKASLFTLRPIGLAFDGGAALALTLFMVAYERPIRRHLNALCRNRHVSAEAPEAARRRLLNEPFVMMGLNLGIWILAAFFFPLWLGHLGEPRHVILRHFCLSLNTGLITAAMIFFVLEHITQGHVGPYFFPEGGLSRTPRTVRVRIVLRMLALLFACNLIPFVSFIELFFFTAPGWQDPAVVLGQLRFAILTNSIFFIVVGVSLTLFVNMNFAIPLWHIVRTLKEIRKGNFEPRVIVASNDEIGYTADVINEMAAGLKERERMRQSLYLASEVQQNLLPQRAPSVNGLDIAGTSLYCDETGGDYYDYLDLAGPARPCIGVAVGDVADHGIQAALTMISARAYIRHHAFHGSDIGDIVSDVNGHICHDVEYTGQFMTLFVCEVDAARHVIRWVRAGHDPALLYEPGADRFEQLGGGGPALGLFEDIRFTAQERRLQPGQVVVIGTDGIWETTRADGEFFGKARLQETVRSHHRESAQNIVDAVLARLEAFSGDLAIADDVTMVVVKVLQAG